MKLPIIFLLLTIISACGQNKHMGVSPGKTTIQEAKTIYGEPLQEQASTLDKDVLVSQWPSFSLQSEKEIITARLEAPLNETKSLQYWRHKYSDKETIYEKLESKDHSASLFQFKVPSEGVAVIYDENADVVVRIISYEAK